MCYGKCCILRFEKRLRIKRVAYRQGANICTLQFVLCETGVFTIFGIFSVELEEKTTFQTLACPATIHFV